MRMKHLLALFPFLLTVPNLLAQEAEESPAASDEAASAAAGLAALGCSFIPCLLALAVAIALAVWVYRDAKARGMDNAMLLTIVTAITGILGLIIYLLMRPKGNLVPCHNCQQKRLEGSATCPHCGQP